MGGVMNRYAMLALMASLTFAARGFAEDCRSGVPIEPYAFVVDPQDTSRPARVVVTDTEVIRGSDTEGTLCISIGSIGFSVTPPEDDRTAGDLLGYVVSLRSGSIDEQAFVEGLGAEHPIEANDGVVWVNFDDRPREDLIAEFTLAAMDEAGNIGQESLPVQIEAGAIDTGCNTAGSSGCAPGAIVLIVVWLVRRKAGPAVGMS
jgi:hypothetical protein